MTAHSDKGRPDRQALFREGAAPSEIVQSVLRAAARVGASDVHFEPLESGLEIRFRLDGVLQEVGTVLPEVALPVIARVKVLAGLATYRTDVPQDGRIPAEAVHQVKRHEEAAGPRAGGSATDLRVSTYPTVRGEKAVVRLFATRAEDFELDSLGLGEEVGATLKDVLACAEGLVVLTGPAGSGKTTTIYAAIRHVNREPEDGDGSSRRHIVTIEDPVECLLPGVTQTETNPAAGLTFANCLRSILRQDPEVIMVGESRDAETASLAVEAALTGHLVLTTLHAGTAAGVFSRLLEMGVEPYLVTSVVKAALSQRLVRRLCKACRRAEQGECTRPGKAGGEGTDPWVASGCPACLGTGYRGRIPLAEIVTLTPGLRERVLARADLDTLEHAARESGMRPLEARAEELLHSGETTRAETERVLARAQSARASGRRPERG